jgi:hypothetical protein
LIVINPEYSQIDEKHYQQYHHQLQRAFNGDADLSAIPCVLSENRINELKSFFGNKIDIKFSAHKNEYRISWKKQDKIIAAIARKNAATDDYTIHDAAGVPLEVVGKKIVNPQGETVIKPVTADYDLLVICPSYESLDLNGKDKTPFSTQASLRRVQWIIKASALPFYFGPKQDPKYGNVSKRDKEVIEALNIQIKSMDKNRQGENLEMFHHGTEWHNPDACDLSHSLPCLFILPNDFVLVENEDELQKFSEVLQQSNYYLPPHSKYQDLTAPKENLFKLQQ